MLLTHNPELGTSGLLVHVVDELFQFFVAASFQLDADPGATGKGDGTGCGEEDGADMGVVVSNA